MNGASLHASTRVADLRLCALNERHLAIQPLLDPQPQQGRVAGAPTPRHSPKLLRYSGIQPNSHLRPKCAPIPLDGCWRLFPLPVVLGCLLELGSESGFLVL